MFWGLHLEGLCLESLERPRKFKVAAPGPWADGHQQWRVLNMVSDGCAGMLILKAKAMEVACFWY